MNSRSKPTAFRKAFLTSIMIGGFSSLAPAENRVLFIGNSFTNGAGESVPEIFDALAIAGGHDDPTTIKRADGGKDYEWHAGYATTQTTITSEQWTHVILQNYSTEPTHITSGGIADHHTFGSQLYEQVIANNSATQVILFETWSRAADHALITGTSTASTFATTAEMQNELRENYQNLARDLTANHPENLPVLVGPVGDAWENAGGLLPVTHPDYVSLHGNDRYHGNDNGYFLAAAVFYATIYGKSPEGLHAKAEITALDLNLTEDAASLERTAWETVSQFGVLRFTSPPENLTVDEGHPATFEVSVSGNGPYSAQWFQGPNEIPDATGLSYTIPNASLAQNNTTYTVTVTNGDESITSDPVTLTVQADETPPTLEKTSLLTPTTLELEFSEKITAPAPGNFTLINRGKQIPVIAMELSPDDTTITLTFASEISGGFVIKVPPELSDLNANLFGNTPPFVYPGDPSFSESILIDFGSAGNATDSTDDSLRSWNNVSSVGVSDTGSLDGLISQSGSLTGFGLQMLRRFNGANSSGTTSASDFPASASGDSLYGNTATFSGLANVFPAFQLTGLDSAQTYQLTFYASRTGASDNRDTLYTVTGANITQTNLNPVENIDQSASLDGLIPDSNGHLTIELSPSPENTNSYQFTYLGILQLSSQNSSPPVMHQPLPAGEHVVIDWLGTGHLERSPTLDGNWTPITPSPTPPYIESMNVSSSTFFRLRY